MEQIHTSRRGLAVLITFGWSLWEWGGDEGPTYDQGPYINKEMNISLKATAMHVILP